MTTFAPFRAAEIAAQTPANPPPATNTSHDRSTSVMFFSGVYFPALPSGGAMLSKLSGICAADKSFTLTIKEKLVAVLARVRNFRRFTGEVLYFPMAKAILLRSKRCGTTASGLG